MPKEIQEKMCRSDLEILTEKSESKHVKNSDFVILEDLGYIGTNPEIMANNDIPKNMVEGNPENLSAKNPECLEILPTSGPKKGRKILKAKRNFGSRQPRRQNGKPYV